MTTEVILRPALPSDIATCAGIHSAWIDDTPWMPRVHPLSDMERYYRESVFGTAELIIAEAGGKAVGFLALLSDGFVSALYLHSSVRGQGIGSRLIAAAKERFPTGLSLWTFEVNMDARRFYGRHGFVERRRTDGDNEEGLPDVLLQWPGRAA